MNGGERRMKYAKNFKCVKCRKQAEVFFGMADPDATQKPYCKRCCEIVKMNIYKRLGV